jgi:phosphatidylglycerol---prolipoprotein diacylglyceryl transferase
MISPIAFSIGNINVNWYGIIFALSFLIAIPISIKLGKERKITKQQIHDYFIYLIPSSVIGARLMAVILNFHLYRDNLLKIFYIWEGGMAFHGGLIGAIVGTYYFCKKNKINFYNMADLIVIPVALGLSLGRIGNFINQEFYGRLTDLPWGIRYDVVEGKRHPSQIYESIKNFIIFLILLNFYKIKTLKRGVIFWMFTLLYSLFRFFVEFYKDQQLLYLNLTYGQLISVPLFILSIIMLKRIGKNKEKDLKEIN